SDTGYSISLGKLSIDIKGGDSDAEETTTATLTVPTEAGDSYTCEWKSSDETKATVTVDSSDKTKATVTAKGKADNVTIYCVVTIPAAEDGGSSSTKNAVAKINITDTKGDAKKAFEDSTSKTVTYKGRTYSVPAGATPSVTIDTFDNETTIDSLTAKVGSTDTTITKTADNTFTLKSVDGKYSVTLTVTPQKVNPTPTVSITNNLPTNTNAISGQRVNLSANYSRKDSGNTITYTWSASDGAEISGNGASATWTPAKSGARQTVTVVVKEGENEAARYVATYTVDPDNNKIKAIDNKTSYTVSSTTPITIPAPALYDKTTGNRVTDASISVSWEDYNSRYISTRQSGNDLVVTGLRTNDSGVKVTATITYKTKTYSIDYTVYVSALDGKLDEVVNGSSLNFDLGDLEKLAENAVYKVDKTDVTIKSVRI
ncbi:hypothetical protein, partial [Barnesiella sp.]|uniref:hypothetical protein n=1 Tax=Barnesiella sp. TaxID=2033407 RepID=UPI00258A1A79